MFLMRGLVSYAGMGPMPWTQASARHDAAIVAARAAGLDRRDQISDDIAAPLRARRRRGNTRRAGATVARWKLVCVDVVQRHEQSVLRDSLPADGRAARRVDTP